MFSGLHRLVLIIARAIFRLFWRPSPPFRDLASEVLEQKKSCAPGTYALAKYVVPRLIAYFDDALVSEISETEWRAYVVARQAKKPGCKLFDDKKYMNQVLSLACRRRFIAERIKLWIPDAAGSSRGREISQHELRRLMRAANPELRLMIEIAVKMGLRRRELLSLRWPDFDWQRRMVRVVSRKTGRARDVPINRDLSPKLRRKMHKAMSDCLFPGRFDPEQPKLDHKTAWQACRHRARVQARWGDLRITCSNLMRRGGADTATIAKILGNSEKVVREWYQRLSADDMHRAAASLSRISRRQSKKRRLAA